MSRKPVITSTKNPLVRRVRDAASGRRPGEVVAEGIKLVRDAIEAGVVVELAVVSPKLADHAVELERELSRHAEQVVECSDAVFDRLSSLTTHQGVLAVVRRPELGLDDLIVDRAFVVVAAEVKDPGNLGAMIRTAEAAGASGFVALAGGADPFRDKAVRGSAGSLFRLPTVAELSLDALVEFKRRAELQLVVADSRGEADYLEVDFRAPTIVALGGEGPGVPAALLDAADRVVRIPMAAGVDSLNVSVATGILLYEARRQRR